jgi:hypothetical protein
VIRDGIDTGVRQVSNGTTTWTVRYTVRGGGRVHYKVFRDREAAASFALWWERRGEGFESVVLPR